MEISRMRTTQQPTITIAANTACRCDWSRQHDAASNKASRKLQGGRQMLMRTMKTKLCSLGIAAGVLGLPWQVCLTGLRLEPAGSRRALQGQEDHRDLRRLFAVPRLQGNRQVVHREDRHRGVRRSRRSAAGAAADSDRRADRHPGLRCGAGHLMVGRRLGLAGVCRPMQEFLDDAKLRDPGLKTEDFIPENFKITSTYDGKVIGLPFHYIPAVCHLPQRHRGQCRRAGRVQGQIRL